jgi:hypothetical protein
MASPQKSQTREPAGQQRAHVCTVDDCNEPAIAAYRWEWGESGMCCAKHQFLLRQKSTPLNRTIQFVALDPGATPSLSRDERTQFHAKILTLEDELRDAKTRGLDLYQDNTKLGEEARRLSARNRELEAQLRDHRAELEETRDERDTHLANLADAQHELGRLQAIMPKTAPTTPPTSPTTPTEPKK